MKKEDIILTELELTRYDRQIMIPGWDESGQKKLKSATIVVAGSGGLGSPSSIYLAAAGVGHLIIVDRDIFELSNLNRQILGWQKDIGRWKAEAAAEKLRRLNPDIQITPRVMEISQDNVGELLENADLVVDALDNWSTRFLINKTCVDLNIPFIHAGVFGLYGQIMTVIPNKGPCLRCLLPETPKDVGKFPVLGATPGLFAMLQVMEALKILVGIGESLTGKMLLFDGSNMTVTRINISRRPDCPVCSSNKILS
ncbi:MAG: HesA/MoeB/ThiF family protein [Candidatus Bathyarchaeota archaeon]|jgi:adenylyltransferase/sulfurtransferase|nr:HesA/MoeB/ThiF family protein [Candidatus Bathyarchaeota archaeon]